MMNKSVSCQIKFNSSKSSIVIEQHIRLSLLQACTTTTTSTTWNEMYDEEFQVPYQYIKILYHQTLIFGDGWKQATITQLPGRTQHTTTKQQQPRD